MKLFQAYGHRPYFIRLLMNKNDLLGTPECVGLHLVYVCQWGEIFLSLQDK